MAIEELGDGVRKVFLAGVGAIASGAQKGQELIDGLVKKGELTVEQGKSLNSELAHKASPSNLMAKAKGTASSAADKALAASMAAMSPADRAAFVRKVNEYAEANAEGCGCAEGHCHCSDCHCEKCGEECCTDGECGTKCCKDGTCGDSCSKSGKSGMCGMGGMKSMDGMKCGMKSGKSGMCGMKMDGMDMGGDSCGTDCTCGCHDGKPCTCKHDDAAKADANTAADADTAKSEAASGSDSAKAK